ncbi:MAG: phosphatidylglycerol:prolipoprotein diacylglycerol transferase [Planctomycetota bacterium]|jgi:phosphatidylglycerol:prolipoprotein diacylglycerol transferase
MHPILFEIPGLGLPIRSFGVMLAIGFVVGAHLWSKLAGKYGDDPEQDPARVSQLVLWTVIGVIAGARLMYIIVEVSKYLLSDNPIETSPGARYLDDPLSIFFIWQGGLVMYGGMLGAAGLGLIKARKFGLRPFEVLDTALISAFVGQTIGRIGCLLVGDDYGSIVPERFRDLPFPITVHIPPAAELSPESLFLGANPPVAGEILWATQIWMSINALILAYIGYRILRNRRYAGQGSLWLFLLYPITRSIIESFRGDSLRGLWIGGLSTSQLVSIPIALTAIALLWRFRNYSEYRQAPEPT